MRRNPLKVVAVNVVTDHDVIMMAVIIDRDVLGKAQDSSHRKIMLATATNNKARSEKEILEIVAASAAVAEAVVDAEAQVVRHDDFSVVTSEEEEAVVLRDVLVARMTR